MTSPDARMACRRPRLRVIVDGIEAAAPVDARVSSTSCYTCDSFHTTLSVSKDSALSQSYWATVERPQIEIQATAGPSSPYRTLILGLADAISIDALRGLVSIDGRDLSSRLIDSCLHQAFPNQPADAIVALLAARHGLEPRVIPTPGLAGRCFAGESEELCLVSHARATTDWDLIVRLVLQYGYDAYVTGNEFHFEPAGTARAGTFSISPDAAMDIRLERRFFGPDLADCAVASWSSQAQRAVDGGSSSAIPGTDGLLTLPPNMMPEVAGRLARAWVVNRSMQAMTVDVEMPGETEMTARSEIAVTGTGTSFDRRYAVEYIDRTFSPTLGFRQRVRARQVLGPAPAALSLLP